MSSIINFVLTYKQHSSDALPAQVVERKVLKVWLRWEAARAEGSVGRQVEGRGAAASFGGDSL